VVGNRELCLKLAKAESVSEVRSILQTEGYWDDPSLWRDYGDIESKELLWKKLPIQLTL